MADFARYCVDKNITCITFNYDDVLDEALWNVANVISPTDKPYWHSDGGYGFFCRPSGLSVQDTGVYKDNPSMLLLKLHGSINWRPRRGYHRPYVVDAIMHHEPWFSYSGTGAPIPTPEEVALHLEPEPFIVPPVLLKSALIEQPILRIVWYQAYEALAQAQQVTFVGYSFPNTDIAVSVLFDEALQDLPQTDISVVNLAATEADKRSFRAVYQTRFRNISDEQFDFRGALDWSGDLVQSTLKEPS